MQFSRWGYRSTEYSDHLAVFFFTPCYFSLAYVFMDHVLDGLNVIFDRQEYPPSDSVTLSLLAI